MYSRIDLTLKDSFSWYRICPNVIVRLQLWVAYQNRPFQKERNLRVLICKLSPAEDSSYRCLVLQVETRDHLFIATDSNNGPIILPTQNHSQLYIFVDVIAFLTPQKSELLER